MERANYSMDEPMSASDWVKIYSRYFKDADERGILISFLSSRMYLTWLYFDYHEKQDRERYYSAQTRIAPIGSERRRARLIDHYQQHFSFYNDRKLDLEVCSITTGNCMEKEDAYDFLNDLIPDPPPCPCNKVEYMHPPSQDAYLKNAQKVVDALKNRL